jgi:outer membrane protein, heavy metal efflux system
MVQSFFFLPVPLPFAFPFAFASGAGRPRSSAPSVRGHDRVARACRVALAALVLAGLTPAPSGLATEAAPTGVPASLTLAQALGLFHARGIDLVIADAEVERAAGDLRAAAAVPNPGVSGALSHSWFDDHQFDTHSGWSIGLTDSSAIEDSLSGKRGLRSEVAQAALASVAMQRADAVRTLDVQVKELYMEVAAAAATVDLAREGAQSAEETFRLNQVRYRSGAISEVDLSKTETAKLEADQALDASRESLHRSGVQLGFWLGYRRGQTVDLAVAIDPLQSGFFSPPILVGLSEEALVDQALAARPDLVGQGDEEVRASRAGDLAARLRFPDIALGLQYQQQGSAASPNPISPPTLMVNLTATLPVFYRQQGEIQRAAAELRIERARKSKLAAQIAAEVKVSLESYRTARMLVERMQGRLLERARRARDLVKLQYEKGAASLLELLDGQRTYILARNEYLQDLTGYWNAVFQLEAAVASELGK